jgi:DNA-binding NtrC family response regulator
MGERILVVEDEETTCSIISSILSSEGYECRTTTRPIEALAILASGEEFALFISNLMMAEMDGLMLLERTRDIFPDMPFVMETGVFDSAVIAKAYEEGVYDYLLKPFPPEWLIAAVRRGLEYRRLKLENRASRAELSWLASASPADQAESPAREHILILVDEENVGILISSMLTSVGYQCRTATGAIEAIAILDSGAEIELLTSSLQMANGNEMFLLDRVRDRFPDMPFVMVTGSSDASGIAAAYQEGAYDYVLPSNAVLLKAAVRRALQYRRLKIENRVYRAELAKNAKAGLDGL